MVVKSGSHKHSTEDMASEENQGHVLSAVLATALPLVPVNVMLIIVLFIILLVHQLIVPFAKPHNHSLKILHYVTVLLLVGLD